MIFADAVVYFFLFLKICFVSLWIKKIRLFSSRKQPKIFAFDHCFNSTDPEIEAYASQEVVFDCLGRDILDNAFQGYNACIFAYGQTGNFC